MGIEVDIDPNRLVATMPVAGNRQPYGLLHGGASAVLAETLGSIAAALHAGPDNIAVGVELNCTHHRSATQGQVTAVCTPLHVGPDDVVLRDRHDDENERRTCTARLTCAVRPAHQAGWPVRPEPSAAATVGLSLRSHVRGRCRELRRLRPANVTDRNLGPPNRRRSFRLLLLDGHSLAYRAFFALPVENFSTTTGQPTNAVFGFTSMLINLLRDEQPTHLAVAFDVTRKTFRTEPYPEYKANRSSHARAFKGQVSLIQEVLAALRIPCCRWRATRPTM